MKRLLPILTFLLIVATTLPGRAEKRTGAEIWAESVALETAGDYAGALALMPEFRQTSRDTYLTYLRSGWLSYSNKKYDDAAKNYQAAAQLEPASVTPLLGLAKSYVALNDMTKAERAYDQVLNRESSNYTALMAVGSLSFARGDYRRAAYVYGNVLSSYPEDTTALSGLAWADLYLKNKQDAAEIFQRLLILSPDHPFAAQGFEAATGKKIASAQR